MKRNKNEASYGKEYFTGSFHGAVGQFTKQDLLTSENWFSGWIDVVLGLIDKGGEKKPRALELGCSIGGAANVLAQRGWDVTASDVSKYAVTKAKKLSPSLTFGIVDIHKPVGPQLKSTKKFDLIYAFEVIEHLKDPEKALKHMYGALKPGGYVVCSSPYPYAYALEEPTHINVRFPEAWRKAFKGAGFTDVKTKQVSFVPLLYKFNKMFSKALPVAVNSRYVNSTVFIVGKRA